jgi:hypothetical protein
LFLIAAGIVIFLSFLKYQSVLTQKETMRVNNQYYLLSEQYRNIKKRYPEINNITNLVELYNLEKLVSVKSLNPSDFLKKLFSINTPNIEVISINWYTEDINVIPDYKFAKTICLRCPHKVECAEWGLRKEAFGMWGALSPTDRRAIRRQKNIFIEGDRSA